VASEVLLTVLDRLFSVAPRLVLKRIYTRAKLDQQVLIDTRSVNPIIFTLSSYVPTVNAWFTVTNMTNLKWRIHDFSAEIWLGQPLATATCHDKPADISRKTRGNVFTRCELNEFQVNRLREWKDRQSKGQVDNVTIYVNARLESTVGLIEFKTTLENRSIVVQ